MLKENTNRRLKITSIGLFGGFFGGLLGIGGSFLVIPFLIGMLGLSTHKAHATALPVAFASGTAAIGFYFTSGHINFALSIFVTAGCLIGVIMGTKMMKQVKSTFLSLLFGIFLIVLGVIFLLPLHGADSANFDINVFTLLLSFIIGLFAGVTSGLFGAGGGTIIVPGTVILLQIGEHMAQGISLVAIIPTTMIGTWMQFKQRNLSLEVMPWLSVSAFVGGVLGGFLAILSHVAFLKGLIVIALLYIGAQNIWKILMVNRPTYKDMS